MHVLERFEQYIKKSAGCWQWLGAKMPRGYGRFYFNGKPRYSHRVALELIAGVPVPKNRIVMHTCDNPACVNPAHLSVATQTENMRDAASKGRTVNRSDWRGTRNPKAKLTPQQLLALRARLADGQRSSDLAREFAITATRVCQIRRAHRGNRDPVEEI